MCPRSLTRFFLPGVLVEVLKAFFPVNSLLMINTLQEMFEMNSKHTLGLGFDLCKHLALTKLQNFIQTVIIHPVCKLILFLNQIKDTFVLITPFDEILSVFLKLLLLKANLTTRK